MASTWLLNFRNFISYIAFFILAVVLLLEFIGIFVFDNRYAWDRRFLFYSEKPIVNEYSTSKTFWKYRPNSKIRFSAVYESWYGFQVEYDCELTTNSFGYIDTGASTDRAALLVLGDSYVEGHGGCPWLIEKSISSDEKLNQLNIFNGGLQGSSVLKFEQTLEYFSSASDIKSVVIFAISNDFKRRDAHPWDVNGKCYSTGECGPEDYWFYVPYDTSQAELLEIARQRKVVKQSAILEFFVNQSFTYRVFQGYKEIAKKNIGSRRHAKSGGPARSFVSNFSALERIRSRFPDLKILLVPQRDEVGLFGKKNLDSQVVERYLEDNSYQYKWCDLSSADYMPLDGHPNSKGYGKLLGCLKYAI